MKKIELHFDMTRLLKPLGRFFRRAHLTLFIIFVAAGLAAAVLFLNNILVSSLSDETYVSPIGAGTIDHATLQRLNELRPSTDPLAEPVTAEGRINPFSE